MTETPRLLNAVRIMITVFILIVMSYGLILLVDSMTSIFAVLGATLMLTYILMTPVDWLQQRLEKWVNPISQKFFKRPAKLRAVTILLVYVGMIVFFVIVGIKTTPVLTDQVQDFSNDLPRYGRRLQHRLNNLPIAPVIPSVEAIDETVNKMMPAPPKTNKTKVFRLKDLAANTVESVIKFGTQTLATVIYGFTALVMVFYLLMDGQRLKQGFVDLLPVGLQRKADHYLDAIHGVFRYFIKSQIILSIVVGAYLLVLLTILNVKYAIFLSIVFAVASIVPVIGPWFGFIPLLIVTLLGNQPLNLIWVLVFTTAYYLLKEYWLFPRLFKNQFEIHPVIIIITFLAGVQLAGPAGILLAFPLACFLCGTYQYLIEQQAEGG